MIYFDNSATSYPKPRQFYSSVKDAYYNYSFNVGRGGYSPSLKAAQKVFSVREQLSDMFSFDVDNTVFTKNCTEALNCTIKGVAEEGDHFIISSLEHNSVWRVLKKLEALGEVSFDILQYKADTEKLLRELAGLIKRNTRAVICTHSSNVFGVTLPINEIGRLCRKKGILFILDASQGAGLFDINAERDNIDIMCSSGHKSLYGPMGTGFMAFRNGVKIKTLLEGGTGSKSFDGFMPEASPDRFEAGTPDVPALMLLGHGLEFIKRKGVEKIYSHSLELVRCLYSELKRLNGAQLYTPYPEKGRTAPILSFNYKDYSSEKTAALLADKNVCVRGGYHCSPLAHSSFGTADRGTVRISTGCFNTFKECDKFVSLLKKL